MHFWRKPSLDAPEQGKWTRPAVPILKYSGAICDFQMFNISSDKANDFPPEEVWIIERSGMALDFKYIWEKGVVSLFQNVISYLLM